MEIKLANDFKEFLKLLNLHHVEYLLIGGYAVSYHGYPQFPAWNLANAMLNGCAPKLMA